MRASPGSKLRRWTALIIPLVFFGLGWALLSLAGLEDDEALFAAPLVHSPATVIFSVQVFHTQLPLMLLTYLGALKTWLYFSIFQIARPSLLAVRLLVLIIGSLTVWLFNWLLERSSGRAVAWVGGLLLATDTMFLFTTCYDWGPVALQHLLTLAGVALMMEFARRGSRWTLLCGFFCFGLALWDKALFLWIFGGLILAALLVFPRELWAQCTPRNLGLAAAGLCLGALPLIVYNAASNLATFRNNSSLNLAQLPSRLHALRITWDGEILWGYMVHAPWSPGAPRAPQTALERMSGVVHSLGGFRYHNQLEPAFWVALALVPLVWFTSARRPMLFCLIAMAAAWLQMAITKDAGLGAHHVVLLWPLPQWFLAVVLVEASRWKALRWRNVGTWALAAAMVFLIGENLLLTNEYFYQLMRYGALGSWSDAIYRLSDEVGAMQPAHHFAIDDWGIANSLGVLRGGTASLTLVNEPFVGGARFADDVWIGHTREYEQRAGVNDRVVRAARAAGFEKQLIKTVPDRSGRPVFELFRFVAGTVAEARSK